MLTRRHSRGQALLETALFMPLFLLGLFGVMLAAKEGALNEKVQLGVRYGGMITSLEQPYLAYSVYSMYATIDGSPSADPNKCSGVATSAAADLTVGRATFWQPTAGSITPTCLGGLSLVAAPPQNILLENSYIGLTANAPVDGYLSANVLGGKTYETAAASENFIRSPDAGSLLSCTPIGDAVKASLEGQHDTLTPDSTASTPFPESVPPMPVIVAPTVCKTYAPMGPLPPASPPPILPSPPSKCTPEDNENKFCIPPPTAPPTTPPPTQPPSAPPATPNPPPPPPRTPTPRATAPPPPPPPTPKPPTPTPAPPTQPPCGQQGDAEGGPNPGPGRACPSPTATPTRPPPPPPTKTPVPTPSPTATPPPGSVS